MIIFCFLPFHLKKLVISYWNSFSGGLKTLPHACEESRKNELIIKCDCQKINYSFFSFAENKNMKNDFKNWEIMFYVDTVEENQLPFDGCTVEENTSSKPPAPRFSQSKNISPQIDSQQVETCFPINDKWPFCKHLEPFCCKLYILQNLC